MIGSHDLTTQYVKQHLPHYILHARLYLYFIPHALLFHCLAEHFLV